MSKFRKRLEDRARELKVPAVDKLTNEELAAAIKDRGGQVAKTEPVTIEAKATEVKTEPAKTSAIVPVHQPVHVAGHPVQMAINVSPPQLQYNFRQSPAWWEVAGRVKDGVLFMVAGGALVYVAMTIGKI